jgi:uncharacterized DUF497 family protein
LLANTLHCSYTRPVAELGFEWDEDKNAGNRRKHGVSFEEARSVFYDDRALFLKDPDETSSEQRFLLLGLSSALRTVVVCHCYRQEDEVIRIISARKATRTEREQYERRWRG